MIEFDQHAHVYRNIEDGTLVPSVSSILRKARVREAPYSGDGRRGEAMQRGLDRGTQVHRLTRSIDETGDLADALEDYFDPAQLLPETANYVAAYQKFLDTSGYVPTAWEIVLYNARLKYAGRADGVGWYGVKRIMIDRKTDRTLNRAVWLQLSLYREAWDEMYPTEKIDETYAVKLNDDMTFKLVRNPIDYFYRPFINAAIVMAKWHDLQVA